MWFSPKLFAIRPVVASNETFVEPLLKQIKYNGSEPVIWTDPSSRCRVAVEGVRRVIFDHLVLSNHTVPTWTLKEMTKTTYGLH